jgi:hypothetical protein
MRVPRISAAAETMVTQDLSSVFVSVTILGMEKKNSMIIRMPNMAVSHIGRLIFANLSDIHLTTPT